jgi:archaellum component FlaF (FlaF/FlaG flagellin family)
MNPAEESSPAKTLSHLLVVATQTVKNVSKAKRVLLDVIKSKKNTERLAVSLKSKSNNSILKEKAHYRAEKELNLSSFKHLLNKFVVMILIFNI